MTLRPQNSSRAVTWMRGGKHFAVSISNVTRILKSMIFNSSVYTVYRRSLKWSLCHYIVIFFWASYSSSTLSQCTWTLQEMVDPWEGSHQRRRTWISPAAVSEQGRSRCKPSTEWRDRGWKTEPRGGWRSQAGEINVFKMKTQTDGLIPRSFSRADLLLLTLFECHYDIVVFRPKLLLTKSMKPITPCHHTLFPWQQRVKSHVSRPVVQPINQTAPWKSITKEWKLDGTRLEDWRQSNHVTSNYFSYGVCDVT